MTTQIDKIQLLKEELKSLNQTLRSYILGLHLITIER